MFAAIAALAAFQLAANAPLPEAAGASAEALSAAAPRLAATETLQHRVFERRRQFLRLGNADNQPARASIAEHAVVSALRFGRFKSAPQGALYEFRDVLSANGRPIHDEAAAERALAKATQGPSEAVRRKALEDFARHLPGSVASDYALVLLNFTSAGQADLNIQYSSDTTLDGVPAYLFLWDQRSSASGQKIVGKAEAAPARLSGKLWVRKADGLPLRVWVWAAQLLDHHYVRDEATVDYAPSGFGPLVPSAIRHIHFVEGETTTENNFTYSPFRLLPPSEAGK